MFCTLIFSFRIFELLYIRGTFVAVLIATKPLCLSLREKE